MKAHDFRLTDLVLAIAGTVDLANEKLSGHHARVAFIAFELGDILGLSAEEKTDLLLAGALHDIGALSLKDRMAIMAFDSKNMHLHEKAGYLLLKTFGRLTGLAETVLHHHAEFRDPGSEDFPSASHILHLADRIAVLLPRGPNVLAAVPRIQKKISRAAGGRFRPELVEAFLDLSAKESFWLDALSADNSFLSGLVIDRRPGLDPSELLEFARLIGRIIDFKSRFTAVHSCGVAASAEALAGIAGFSENKCRTMKIAGHLHDLGKLAVPSEIIELPRSLDFSEYGNMRRHTFYTHQVLREIKGFDTINEWASLHHERLDGSGYPFHISRNDLSTGSRIMAVADVFTALTEDRPYRAGMKRSNAMKTIHDMADRNMLDRDICAVLGSNFSEINHARKTEQAGARAGYEQFRRELQGMSGTEG